MSSFVVSLDELKKKTNPEYSEMNDISAATIYAIADPSVKALIPPPLELADPPLLIIYVSNINKPTFTAPYIEGGIGVLANLVDSSGVTHTGLYYFNLQLHGWGAQNATFMGREESGLPKKIADSISLKRRYDKVFFHVERNGIRLLDAVLKIGRYNDPDFANGLESLDPRKGLRQEGGVLTHRYNTDDVKGLHNMRISYYDSPTFYHQYEPAYAWAKLQSSQYDPWGEIKIAKILGGSWAKNDNSVAGVTNIYTYPDAEAWDIMRYLYTGRFDPLIGRR
ncbi:MAG: acetoacetate decarboxylase family protein [Defluviitaleaceae bacterium]|nr:acetoacetate decarboxylase family protein [Defluviitaleaceae bacterium]